MVIEAKFEVAQPFVDGKAIVKQNGHFGLIDTKGAWLIPAEFDEIQRNDLYRLQKSGKYGLANSSCEFVAPLIYDGIFPLKNGYFLMLKDGKKGLANSFGTIMIPLEYDHIAQLRDNESNYVELFEVWEFGLRGIYNACGEMIQHPRFSSISVFQNGFSIVEESDRFGLIDVEGNLRMDCQFEQLTGPNEGLLAAKVKNRWGFVDEKGQQILPFLFEEVQENGFYQGRAAVKQAGDWIFIQRNGKVDFPVEGAYQSVGRLSEGLAAVCNLAQGGAVQFGYADPSGKLKIPFRYERAEAFRKGFAIVGARREKDQSIIKEMRYGVIDLRGKEIIPPTLHSQTEARLKRDSLGHLGFATMVCRGKQCKVNYQGRKYEWQKNSFEPNLPTSLGNACDNSELKPVMRKGLWGFENRKGKIAIPCEFALVQCFQDGLALVWPNEGSSYCYYIDQDGNAYHSGE